MARCCEKVVPENAARQFNSPAPILKKTRVQALLREHLGGRVLDVGAGNLRNSMFLQASGFEVTAVDLPAIESRFPERYDAFKRSGGRVHLRALVAEERFDVAVCTFVIETVCRPDLRIDLLSRTRKALRPAGLLLISTRGPADLVTAHAQGRRCGDGYITPNKSFARAFTRAQLRALLVTAGFGRIEFLHKSNSHSPELLHALAYKTEA